MTWCAVGSFGDAVAKFERETAAKLDLAARKIVLEVFSRVILRSPVASGRFRGNWQVEIGSVPSGTLELNDKDGTATVSKAAAASMGVKAGDVVYLANNLPYAMELEEGHSQQAPAGMVNLTAQEFSEIVEAIGIELSMT